MGAVQFVSIALPAIFWPVVVVLIAWWQRKPIGRLIDRVRTARLFGQEIHTAPPSPPSELANAVERGTSSPEVEELIRSMDETQQTPSSEETVTGDSMRTKANEHGSQVSIEQSSARETWITTLRDAQRRDESHRRSEIERVMMSAARWGAKLARNAPNDDDAWEPVVNWNDEGEPEITAVRRPAFRERMRREVTVAQAMLENARMEAMKAGEMFRVRMNDFRENPQSPEAREMLDDARMQQERARRQVENAERQMLSLKSALAWAEN
jgi:hypothetical protein